MIELTDLKIATDSQEPLELARLAEHPDESIRAYVAENPYTPAEILEWLSNDVSPRVLIYLLRNKSLPLPIFLSILTRVTDSSVKREACVLAVQKYRTGQLDMSPKELVAIIKTLDLKADALTLIEVVETLHTLHEAHK